MVNYPCSLVGTAVSYPMLLERYLPVQFTRKESIYRNSYVIYITYIRKHKKPGNTKITTDEPDETTDRRDSR